MVLLVVYARITRIFTFINNHMSQNRSGLKYEKNVLVDFYDSGVRLGGMFSMSDGSGGLSSPIPLNQPKHISSIAP